MDLNGGSLNHITHHCFWWLHCKHYLLQPQPLLLQTWLPPSNICSMVYSKKNQKKYTKCPAGDFSVLFLCTPAFLPRRFTHTNTHNQPTTIITMAIYRNVVNWDDTSVSWVLGIIGLSCTHKDGYKVQEAFMHGNNEDKKKAIFFAIACAAYCLCLCHSWYMVLPQTWPCDPLPWALIGGNSHCPFTDAVDVAACHISLVWAFSSCLTWLCSARGGVIVVLLLLVLALDQLSSVYCEHLLS